MVQSPSIDYTEQLNSKFFANWSVWNVIAHEELIFHLLILHQAVSQNILTMNFRDLWLFCHHLEFLRKTSIFKIWMRFLAVTLKVFKNYRSVHRQRNFIFLRTERKMLNFCISFEITAFHQIWVSKSEIQKQYDSILK